MNQTIGFALALKFFTVSFSAFLEYSACLAEIIVASICSCQFSKATTVYAMTATATALSRMPLNTVHTHSGAPLSGFVFTLMVLCEGRIWQCLVESVVFLWRASHCSFMVSLRFLSPSVMPEILFSNDWSCSLNSRIRSFSFLVIASNCCDRKSIYEMGWKRKRVSSNNVQTLSGAKAYHNWPQSSQKALLLGK